MAVPIGPNLQRGGRNTTDTLAKGAADAVFERSLARGATKCRQ